MFFAISLHGLLFSASFVPPAQRERVIFVVPDSPPIMKSRAFGELHGSLNKLSSGIFQDSMETATPRPDLNAILK